MRARTPVYLPHRFSRTQHFIEQTQNVRVHNTIIDIEAILLIHNHIGFAQDAQLLRDIRLGTAQHSLEMAHTRCTAPQFIQDEEPRRMGKQSKNRCALGILC